MKTLPAALLAHYQTGCTTVAYALKITREDAAVYAFTSDSRNAVIAGVTYLADPGVDISSISTQSGLAVGNMEIQTLHDESVFVTTDVLGGRWRNAAFVIYRYNWSKVADGVEEVLSGNLGEVELHRDIVKVELRDVRQALQQPFGSVTSPSCRYRYGSSDVNNGGLCMLDISGSPHTVSGAVTSVTDNRVFTDTSKAQASDFFGNGKVTWLTGNNAGLSHLVSAFASGAFTLALPTWLTIQVGDTYMAVEGCRKRLADCIAKRNVLNFGGEPHKPTLNELVTK